MCHQAISGIKGRKKSAQGLVPDSSGVNGPCRFIVSIGAMPIGSESEMQH